MVGQELQDDGGFFTVFFCDGPAEGVDLARVRGGVNCVGIDFLDRLSSFHPARFLSVRGHFVVRRPNVKIIGLAVNGSGASSRATQSKDAEFPILLVGFHSGPVPLTFGKMRKMGRRQNQITLAVY